MDAVLKARRIARNAELVEIAKGKQTWWLWVFPLGFVLALSYLGRSGGISTEVTSMSGAFVLAGWAYSQIGKRLDAVVELLLDEQEQGPSA